MQFAEKKNYLEENKKRNCQPSCNNDKRFLFVGETWKLQKEAKIKQKRGFRRKKTFV
jgi:hypothetical protein